jgi:hypothetical protein
VSTVARSCLETHLVNFALRGDQTFSNGPLKIYLAAPPHGAAPSQRIFRPRERGRAILVRARASAYLLRVAGDLPQNMDNVTCCNPAGQRTVWIRFFGSCPPRSRSWYDMVQQ